MDKPHQLSRFRLRLQELGFNSYDAYLESDHWKGFRAAYKASGLPVRCAVCDQKPVQLHHHNYGRLGCEELSDVTPLCREHHTAVHQWLADSKQGVWNTKEAVAFLRGEPQPVRQNRKTKKAKRVSNRILKRRLRKRRRALAQYNHLYSIGIRHPKIPPNYVPSVDDPKITKYAGLLKQESNHKIQPVAFVPPVRSEQKQREKEEERQRRLQAQKVPAKDKQARNRQKRVIANQTAQIPVEPKPPEKSPSDLRAIAGGYRPPQVRYTASRKLTDKEIRLLKKKERILERAQRRAENKKLKSKISSG